MTKIRSRQQTGLTKISKPNQAFIQQQLIELDEFLLKIGERQSLRH